MEIHSVVIIGNNGFIEHMKHFYGIEGFEVRRAREDAEKYFLECVAKNCGEEDVFDTDTVLEEQCYKTKYGYVVQLYNCWL